MTTKRHINLLWTGGWDSTFQLLQLLIIERCKVTPYYIVDNDRKSTKAELNAMELITIQVLKQYPYTKELLDPLQFFNRNDIPLNDAITKAHEEIQKDNFIGVQYEWLARFCDFKGINELQLCIFKDGRVDRAIANYRTSNETEPDTFFIDEKFKNTKEYTLFKYFSFPILSLNKHKINEITKAQNMSEIMELTWFCHQPTSKMKPCGKCHPCLYTAKEGLGSRIPLKSRIRGYIKKEKIKLKAKFKKR